MPPPTNHAYRAYVDSARILGVTTIFPLASLSYMLLRWQQGELKDVTLDDTDYEDEQDGDDSEPGVRYTTEKEYQECVLSVPMLITIYLPSGTDGSASLSDITFPLGLMPSFNGTQG
jgi:hypothetical protein